MAGNLTFFGICSFAVVRSESGFVPRSFVLEGEVVLLLLVRSAVVVDNQFLRSVADRFLYGSSSLYTWSRGISHSVPLTIDLFNLEGQKAIFKVDWLNSRNGINYI